ncbi:MAG: thiamine-phosphate kinase [Bacteroidia bacterium]|nr:thiamine-phosphate kinase [Bacteroidia bacterium]MCO5255062.1 thiamine-phosphate kinase [Bacteroidota bacterium]MCZ2129820.1 thiamine-phosphate kinase [Bacteroidia bacterium]
MFENQEKSKIELLGEFGLIDHLTGIFHNTQPSTIKGVGDDAAVIDCGEKYMLVSNDILLEGVHFDFVYTPLKHLGYKAVSSNISDIAAMNGKATQIVVSIGLSSKITLEAIEEVYAGIHAACEHYEVDLVGGDTSSSSKGLFISITAIGFADKNKITYRKGAKKAELVCVSGDLGAAYTGYMLLEREKRLFMENPDVQPDMEGNDYILQRQLKPEARVDIISLLNKLNITPSSMIDVSDGISSELHHLSKHSELGFVIYEDKLPIDQATFDKARELGLDPTVCALNGGEDYELLFTLKQEDYDKIKNNADISIIGYATDLSEGICMISRNGNKHKLEAQGWQHV